MTTGQHVSKGEELGLFKFGGSMLTVAFEQGRIKFDSDLERWSLGQIMVVESVHHHRNRHRIILKRDHSWH